MNNYIIVKAPIHAFINIKHLIKQKASSLNKMTNTKAILTAYIKLYWWI